MCNYYFFLQRAKLAQGLNQMLPLYVFERGFPILFVCIYILYIIIIILIPINGHRSVSPNTGRTLCIWDTPDLRHQLILYISTLFDLSMTAFFLYLYGKPMCMIARNISTSNDMNSHEMKLRRCIIVNFVCSSTSSIHTAIICLFWWNISFFSWWTVMDYVVNCLCLFGMFASNRRCCLHCFCCNGSIRNEEQRMLTVYCSKCSMLQMRVICHRFTQFL